MAALLERREERSVAGNGDLVAFFKFMYINSIMIEAISGGSDAKRLVARW